MKEYGPHSHFVSKIIKESLYTLIVASVLSSLGGVGLEDIQTKLLTILPLIILVPALNDMMGDFGTVISSKFTTALYLGNIRGVWWKSHFVKKVFINVFVIAMISGIYISTLSFAVAYLRGFLFDFALFIKILEITLLSIMILFFLIFSVSVVGSIHIFKNNEDPSNFLIPITTSIADLVTMLIFSLFVLIFL